MECRELSIEEITDDILDKFERYEEINKAWRIENNIRILKDVYYTEHWDAKKLRGVCQSLKKTLLSGGGVFAIFDNDIIIGFASLENNLFGSKGQYLQLSMLQITRSYRRKGIGKLLFKECIGKAKEHGAGKIYISASSSENAQLFYEAMGCVQAVEINNELAILETFDIQMEYVL